MEFEKDKDITSLTTFGVPVCASLFAEYSNVNDLIRICRSEEYRENLTYHIGGGSNLLFINNFDGLILHSAIKGIKAYDKGPDLTYLIVGAGEKWTDVVDYCIDNGLAGLENLAGIPGEAGASPVQNVGAYGVEAGDLIHTVECLDRETLKVVTLKGEECGFAYRNSNFKTIWKDKYYVLRVSYRLKRSDIATSLEYRALQPLKEEKGDSPVTLRDVRDYIYKVRNSKLPDPKYIGSAGSFFKNPIVRRKYYEAEMLNLDSSIPCYDIAGDETHVKIPAGWLIEHAGLKGVRIGGAEVYQKNALVLTNIDHAKGTDVKELAQLVARTVNKNFHVMLEPEVNFLDTSIYVRVLGSGTSKGVPELLCDCAVCKSDDPKDYRQRASVLVETMGVKLLIDVSPDFRKQALDADLRHVDGVLITHEHYDHVGGIDDLRPYCLNAKVDMYMKEDVARHLRSRLDYCFSDTKYPGVPTFNIIEVDKDHPFSIKGVEIEPIGVFHGKLPILGYRIGKFAYITDAKYIDEEELDKLYGLDVLIVNALRDREHFAHFTIQQALDVIEKVKPKRAYLTHLCHEVGKHEDFAARLPENVYPAYDGLEIRI